MILSPLQGCRSLAAALALTSLATAQTAPTARPTAHSPEAPPSIAIPIRPGEWTRPQDPQPDRGVVLQEFATRQTPVVFTPPEDLPPQTSPDTENLLLNRESRPQEEHVHFDVRDGVQWARGVNYKASAGPDGFTFIPNFGPEAPQNYPIRLRLESASLGAQTLELSESAAVTRQDARLVLDRGPVAAWYDMGLDSVEQSFAIDAAGAAGDLQLLVAVETELVWHGDAQGFTWANDLGTVHYSKAVVVDGKGTRLEIPLGRKGQQIELTVPSSYLAQAVNPIVVDPILTVFSVYPANNVHQISPDVAYDFTNDRFAYIVQSNYSATDHDLRIETYSGSGTYIASAWVDFSSGDWTNPAIASDNATNTFLVVAEYLNGATGTEIWGRTVDAVSLGNSPAFLIGEALLNSWTNGAPDVGGKSQGSSLFKVVWERSFNVQGVTGIRSRTVIPTNPHSTSVAPTVGSTEFVTNDSSTTFSTPAISKSSGQASNAEWRVVFGAAVVGTGAESINSARYADDNTLLHAYSPLFTIPSPTYNLISLDVSDGLAAVPGPTNGDPTYMIVGDFNGTFGPQVWWYGMDRDSYFDVQSVSLREHRSFDGDEKYDSSIATSSNNFVITYLEYAPSIAQFEVYQTKCDLVTTGFFGVSERRLRLGSTPFRLGFQTCSASRFSGGNYGSRQCASAFDKWDGSTWRTAGQVTYQDFQSIAGYQYCTGNPNSTGDYGHLIVFGDASVAGTKTLAATDLAYNQFGYFLAGQGGFGTINVSNGVQCLIGGPLGRYNQPLEVFFTGTSGTASLTIGPGSYRGPTGNVAVFAGQTWNFQAWHRENGGASNFSDAVSVRLF